MKHLGFLLAMGIILAAGNHAIAMSVFELDGEPVDASSWKQQLRLLDPVGVTKIVAQIDYSGTSVQFSSPTAMDELAGWNPNSLSGWSQSFLGTYDSEVVRTEVWGTGTAYTGEELRFRLSFGDSSLKQNNTPDFTLHLTAYAGSTLVAHTDLLWDYDSGTWPGWQEVQQPPVPGVPEPLTMAGMLLGVGGLVQYLRKRRPA